MQLDNPMHRDEVVDKVVESRDYRKQSQMMRDNNPMHDPEVVARSVERNDFEAAGEKRTGEDNPMYGRTPEFKSCGLYASEWEAEVHMLIPEFEHEGVTIEGPGWTYTPDFVNGNTIVEVKGHVFRESIIEKFEWLLNTDWFVIVVGAELPCDVHIEYDNREEIVKHVSS